MNRWGQHLALAGLAALPSCASPRTELIVAVSSDFDEASLRSVVIDVYSGPTGSERRGHLEVPLGGASGRHLPVTFGIVPRDDDPARVVRIEVVGCREVLGCGVGEDGGSGASALVTQRAVVGFVPDAIVQLSLPLQRRCEGVVCDRDSTCQPVSGRCADARLDSRTLPRIVAHDLRRRTRALC